MGERLERMIPFRINTSSIKVALRTARLMEGVIGGRFDIAVSSRNIIMLDCDNPDRLMDFIDFCAGICKEFLADGIVYKTPRGYHFILRRFVSFPRWKWFYKALLKEMDKNPELEKVIDRVHVEATLRREYTTLRINQIERIAYIEKTGEIRWYTFE